MTGRRYMAEIFLIRPKTLSNQSISMTETKTLSTNVAGYTLNLTDT